MARSCRLQMTLIHRTRQRAQRQIDRAVQAQRACERDHHGTAGQEYERQARSPLTTLGGWQPAINHGLSQGLPRKWLDFPADDNRRPGVASLPARGGHRVSRPQVCR